MRRLITLVLVALAAPACDPAGSLTEEEALDVTCMHAAGAFGVIPFAGGSPTRLGDVARVLELDARLLDEAGAQDAADLVSETAAALRQDVENGGEVTAYFSGDSSEAERDALEELAGGLPGVESVEYVSSEEAYEQFLEQEGELPGMTADMLPDSLEIFLADGVEEDEIAQAIEGEPGVDEVRFAGNLEPVTNLQRLGRLCDLPL